MNIRNLKEDKEWTYLLPGDTAAEVHIMTLDAYMSFTKKNIDSIPTRIYNIVTCYSGDKKLIRFKARYSGTEIKMSGMKQDSVIDMFVFENSFEAVDYINGEDNRYYHLLKIKNLSDNLGELIDQKRLSYKYSEYNVLPLTGTVTWASHNTTAVRITNLDSTSVTFNSGNSNIRL